MNKDFTEVMAQRSDEELIKILTVHKEDYQPEAIHCAEKELQKRNLSIEEQQTIKEEVVEETKQKNKIESNVPSSMLRFVHLLVDTISYLVLYFIIAGTINLVLTGTDQLTLGFISFVLLIALYFAYYIVLEVKFGKTIGKMLTKTIVVKPNGESPTSTDIFIRTLCRLIPFDQFSYIFTKNGFHDYLSKTTVIRRKN
ncbi:RDD family protein [Carboxylicivirga sp. M1479]|uniref:RDD family protein n=1 Tax=Carboxylicivirga sp. M1479 TaxID=2594476 RepID=UPI00117821B8|nr:RDD family protein [Carboxylicivirga sp. M1479]TRX65967.1 RDD family protein [Carboxylicivirga sp. M1479]